MRSNDEDKKVIERREKIREVKRNFFATIFNELLTGKKIWLNFAIRNEEVKP